MNKFEMLTTAGAVAAVAALAASPALATEGYFSHGFGAVNKSMAGAGVALSMDAMSQANNPASLTGVDSQFTADISIFSPHRSHTVTGAPSGGGGTFPLNPGSFDSDREYFVIPGMAGSYSIDDASAYGWAIYGNGGMNTTWKEPAGGVFGGGKTGVDLAQAFLQFTYARELSPGISVGISPILVAQRFKAFGLVAFSGFSSNAAALTDNGYDWSYGYGGKLGVQAEIGGGFSVGAAYQSRMYMTEFDKYAGLFAEQGDFDIPASLQAGFGWDSGAGVKIALDYKRIFYSDIDAVANPMLPNLVSAPGNLGSNNGAGFGWETINAYKLGVEWQVSPVIAVRAGIGINDNPIGSNDVMFNILAPGVQEQHYTAGLTWQVSPNSAVNFGLMYSPTSSVSGPNPLEAPGQQTIELEMWQWEGTVGWTWTF